MVQGSKAQSIKSTMTSSERLQKRKTQKACKRERKKALKRAQKRHAKHMEGMKCMNASIPEYLIT